MQEIAAPGGIAISDIVRGQVHDKLDVVFVDDSEHAVKNIAEPVRVWRWSADEQPRLAESAEAKPLALPDKPSIAVLPFDTAPSWNARTMTDVACKPANIVSAKCRLSGNSKHLEKP